MSAKRNVLAGELSYAEQRLLEIGITISSRAGVILLDEPMQDWINMKLVKL